MRLNGLIPAILVGVLFLGSCEKDELPKPILDQQGSVLQVLEMGETYSNQIGFSLQDPTVDVVEVMDWDIYIYPSKKIRLNTSRFMKVLKVADEEALSLVYHDSLFTYDDYSKTTFDFKLEASEAIRYYIIDLGRNIEGDVLPKVFTKIHINSNQLIVEYKRDDQTVWKLKSLDLTSNIGRFFSFVNEEEFTSPLFVQSDFYCGGYITRFNAENLDYLVRGVLLNKTSDLEVAEITNLDYDDISLANVPEFDFKQQMDQIGYDWKYYNIDEGLYLIDQTKIYIIKYGNGLIYKLKFIDYYSDIGKKGFPTLSYALLE